MDVPFIDNDYVDKLFALIQINPYEAKVKLKKYIKDYPVHYIAYCCYASCLIMLGELDEAEKVLDYVQCVYKRNSFFSSKKNFVDSLEESILIERVKILSFKEKYEELYNLYMENQEILYDKLKSQFKFYFMTKVNGNVIDGFEKQKENVYIYKQIMHYTKKDFLQHIIDHLGRPDESVRDAEKSVFFPNFPINRVVSEIEKNISNHTCMYTKFYNDTYIFKYNNCGFDGDETTDYFKVVCFHNTHNIITMYPYAKFKCENLPCIDLSYIINENIANKYISSSQSNVCVSSGDVIMVDGVKYLVKKQFDKTKVSVLKIVGKGNCDVHFKYGGKEFCVLKDAVILDNPKAKIIEKHDSRLINEFEKVKKIVHGSKKDKTTIYQLGAVILFNNKENIVIDHVGDYVVVVDRVNNFSFFKNNKKYKIKHYFTKEELEFMMKCCNYTEEVKKTILSKIPSSNPR